MNLRTCGIFCSCPLRKPALAHTPRGRPGRSLRLQQGHTRTYIHTYIHTYIYIYTRTHTHTYINTYTHTYTHIHTRTYTHTYIHTYTCTQRCGSGLGLTLTHVGPPSPSPHTLQLHRLPLNPLLTILLCEDKSNSAQSTVPSS